MKLFFCLVAFILNVQMVTGKVNLSISPAVDQNDSTHQAIIKYLELFLATKNQNLRANPYWLATDYKQFPLPFLDLYNIERGQKGPDYYQPALMEIIGTAMPTVKMVKLAFIGHHPETHENTIRCIYNIMVKLMPDQPYFYRALPHLTQNWETIKYGSITYKISPLKQASQDEMAAQKKDIQDLCQFFNTAPIPITYYSCISPKSVFTIKGFDYLPNMYFGDVGGMIEGGHIVFSGNNSDQYTHEIVHIYTGDLYPNLPKLLDEGIATYIGGSGGINYQQHKAKLRKHVKNHEIDFLNHLDPYEKFYIDQDTPVPYMIGALICEYTHRLHGHQGLLTLFQSTDDLWQRLNQVGISKTNFNASLRQELEKAVLLYH